MLLASYGDDLRPGDVYIMKRPIRRRDGRHTSHIYIVKPVFHEGEHLGFAVTTAHHGDVRGRLPGTTASDNTDVFQEGLRLPGYSSTREANRSTTSSGSSVPTSGSLR